MAESIVLPPVRQWSARDDHHTIHVRQSIVRSGRHPQDVAGAQRGLQRSQINGNATAREVIAIRIIELTKRGERDHTLLRDRLRAEANGGTGC